MQLLGSPLYTRHHQVSQNYEAEDDDEKDDDDEEAVLSLRSSGCPADVSLTKKTNQNDQHHYSLLSINNSRAK